ncbi:YcbK family protein, partial [Vibrio alginolyticus]|uniref:YcbK family protein n=1 Tax=Vibrio alginolyticus TaxID=663 RepID=UPI00301CCFCF
VAIDDRLILILIAMQTYLDSYGYIKPIIVTSAYRSEKTNSKLLGEGASKNSMHLTGQAVDIRIPGLSPSYMSKLAA